MQDGSPPNSPELLQQLTQLVAHSGRTSWEVAKEFELLAQALKNRVAQAIQNEDIRCDATWYTHAEETSRQNAMLLEMAGRTARWVAGL